MDIRDTTEATVPFTHRSDNYNDVINGELLAAKWSPDSNSFTAILKETNPATGDTELAHVKTYLQDIPEASRMRVTFCKSELNLIPPRTKFSPPVTQPASATATSATTQR